MPAVEGCKSSLPTYIQTLNLAKGCSSPILAASQRVRSPSLVLFRSVIFAGLPRAHRQAHPRAAKETLNTRARFPGASTSTDGGFPVAKAAWSGGIASVFIYSWSICTAAIADIRGGLRRLSERKQQCLGSGERVYGRPCEVLNLD